MPMRTRLFSQPAGVVSALCVLWFAAGLPLTPAHAQQPAAPQAVPVGTVAAEKKPISKTDDFVGRVEAINRVQVKARVTGYLDAILFKEGDTIAEGAPVYRLEKGQFEAAVKQAEGALERNKAAKVLSVVQLQRADDLVKRSAGTEVARDQALAADQQASGAILEAEANLQTAKINLGYTDIVSPIAGKIGRTSVTRGNVVGPDTGTLTTIVSQDPMYVTFPVSQRDFLRAQQTGSRPDLQALKVRAAIFGRDRIRGDRHAQLRRRVGGPLDRHRDGARDGAQSEGRADRRPVDEGRGRGRHAGGKDRDSQSALIADQEGVYIFVVQDGKATVRRVRTGGAAGTGVIIDSGLQGGEQVIVQGLQSVRPGAPVRATPARMPGQS